MATTRATGFKITAAIWNAVLSGVSDAGNVWNGISMTLSGALSAASLTLSGALSAAAGAFSGAVTMASTLVVTGAATFNSAITEYGRSVAQGVEIGVAFNAANFTATGGVSPTYVVSSGNVQSNSYTLLGKQLFWSCRIIGAGISNISNDTSALIFTIPGGYSAAVVTGVMAAYVAIGGTSYMCRAEATGTTVALRRNDAGTFANNGSSTDVEFDIRIPIN